MNGYRVDHRNFSFVLTFPESLQHLGEKPYLIERIDLEKAYARIVTGKRGERVIHRFVKLRKTPHYRFLEGAEEAYVSYLKRWGKDVGYGIEHSVESYRSLIESPEGYLEGEHRSEFIVCERVKSIFGEKIVILDGVHRACILLYQGVREIPAAVLLNRPPGEFEQLDVYMRDFKDDFLEWYTPVSIRGRVIHERTFPDYKERPEFLSNRERGESKWNYIIRRNLPPVKGKRVCDVGCNVGLFSLFLALEGAAVVHGFDRGESVVQPSNPDLPRQNVVQQAYFVRNLFRLAGFGEFSNVEFFECDINTLDFSSFDYDVFFSCCVLYHFGERFGEIINQISRKIPVVFLQTNLGHKGSPIEKYASIEYHVSLLEECGYRVRVDAPEGYNYPVIVGEKR